MQLVVMPNAHHHHNAIHAETSPALRHMSAKCGLVSDGACLDLGFLSVQLPNCMYATIPGQLCVRKAVQQHGLSMHGFCTRGWDGL
eukprot:1143430-Pelagomonas_calceolata.AAC.3